LSANGFLLVTRVGGQLLREGVSKILGSDEKDVTGGIALKCNYFRANFFGRCALYEDFCIRKHGISETATDGAEYATRLANHISTLSYPAIECRRADRHSSFPLLSPHFRHKIDGSPFPNEHRPGQSGVQSRGGGSASRELSQPSLCQ
jgi:hypothetical protein